MILQHLNLSPWKPVSCHSPCRMALPLLGGLPCTATLVSDSPRCLDRLPPFLPQPHELLFLWQGWCFHWVITAHHSLQRFASSHTVSPLTTLGGRPFVPILQVRKLKSRKLDDLLQVTASVEPQQSLGPKADKNVGQVVCLQVMEEARGRPWGREPGGGAPVRGLTREH